MAKKNRSKPISVASTVIVIIAAVIAAYISYKQIYLVSKVTANLPEQAMSTGIGACMQKNLTPAKLKQDLAKTDLNLDLGSLFGSVWDTVSSTVVETRVEKNYIGEVKVLSIQDFLGKNADMRITGSVDVVSKVPVAGEFRNRKDYQLVLVKRDKKYHFDGLSVKNPDSQQWDVWECAQDLGFAVGRGDQAGFKRKYQRPYQKG
jgi:hypothetical protein